MLPKLCNDLKEKKMDSLQDYFVPWTHVNMSANAPSSELDHYLLGEMCIEAAKGVELQCEREYWANNSDNVHANLVKPTQKKTTTLQSKSQQRP